MADSVETDSAAAPAVEFRGIRKSYVPNVPVINGIDLSIKTGDFVTLLGPSGSGKTTLLMMLAGFVQPDEGRLLTLGKDITTLAPEQRQLGVVFQNYALFPTMSVAGNVDYPLAVRRMPKAQRKLAVQEALDLVHMGNFGGRRITELSGGQQQRVALARALVYEPSVLLLDEPLGALDRALRGSMQSELRSLNRRLGTTFILVTHDQDEAITMSDRIVVMRDGAIEQVGSPQDVYERPETDFVANFLGNANVFHGKVAGSDPGILLGDGSLIFLPEITTRASGSAATVIVRPDRVTLETAPRHGRASLAGRLASEAYAGGSWKYGVATGVGSFEVAASQRIQPQIGEAVVMTWQPEDSWLIPDGSAVGKSNQHQPQ